MTDVKEFLRILELDEIADGRYQAGNLDSVTGVVFGGQILGQVIVAAARVDPTKSVKSVHTIFVRAARPTNQLEIDVDTMQCGRTFASATVSVHQGDRLCARALVLLHADEKDFVRHAGQMPVVEDPDVAMPMDPYLVAGELRAVAGVDLVDPDAVGEARFDLWFRCPGAGKDLAVNQAILADATDMFLIGTAMRPHRGVGQSLAHRSIDTGVISHTLTFHERISVDDWLLIAHESPHAGAGRSFGRADVFSRHGELVASFVQESLIRALPDSALDL